MSDTGAGVPHDHAWRRGGYERETDTVEYSCDLCDITYAGPVMRPDSRS
jgi:hypothetical protein